ncbi:MAG: LysR substrate-binding domain-containing protein [Cohaesibacter sp.]|nr:LysR substrate-binding domain-containing protein [Cohaesibacter sp.]
MRYSQLKAFHHVAMLGGFSMAAKALYLTQPAISEQVRKLEQTHDVLLFSRERKRILLTPEGERLFHLTKQFFEVEQQIEDYMSESGAAIDGQLRIIVDSAHHITEVLSRFRQRYPKVTVNLRTGNSEDVLNELRSYDAEIGVIGSLQPGSDMTMQQLSTTKIIAFAARDLVPDSMSHISLKELANYPLIFREDGSKTRQKLEEALLEKGLDYRPAIVAEGREAVQAIVASGAGVGFVSHAEYGLDERLRPLPIDELDITMSEALIHLNQRSDVKLIRAFMDVAKKVQAEHAMQDMSSPM